MCHTPAAHTSCPEVPSTESIVETPTCPRCFLPLPHPAAAKFCPRCGLPDVAAAAADTSPMDLTSGGRTYRVLDRLAIGSLSTLYRCEFPSGGRTSTGILKLARDPRTSGLLANEAAALRHLHAAPDAAQFAPFLPTVEASFDLASEGPPRRGNVLRLDAAIASPDELYSLEDVRQAYPDGIDARDAAWIWRRLLHVLGFAHAHGVAHRAVLPPHVLIEPRGHKLVLVDWCCAALPRASHPPDLVTGGFADWYRRAGVPHAPLTPALDIGLAARCAIDLLGGDPVRARFPASLDPALQRYFGRCLGPDGRGAAAASAFSLLEDFDRLIKALWGPRTFRQFTLPPKSRQTTTT